MSNEHPARLESEPAKLSIKVIGLGGAGINAVSHMAGSDLRELSFLAMHTNERVLTRARLGDRLLFGQNLMRGLGAGGDPDLGRAAAEEEMDRLIAVCEGADLLFIVGGLGGGTATGAAPILARAAKEAGALVLALVTLPFEFEGTRRLKQAEIGLQNLRSAADGVICLPHQNVVQLIDDNTSFLETFSITNEMLAQGVRGIWQMLTRHGLINVDFSDLCAVLRGRQAESCFATAEARGEGRAREIAEKLLGSPLLEQGKKLAEADAVLVSMIGGPDLSMQHVNWVMEQINRQADHAEVIMGAAIDPECEGLIGVTLVASKRGKGSNEDGYEGSAGDFELRRAGGWPPAEIENPFFSAPVQPRPASPYVPPPPALTREQRDRLLAKQGRSASGKRNRRSPWRQGQLPLEMVSRGRFEKSEPTLHRGEDLDVPTYIRRGVALN